MKFLPAVFFIFMTAASWSWEIPFEYRMSGDGEWKSGSSPLILIPADAQVVEIRAQIPQGAVSPEKSNLMLGAVEGAYQITLNGIVIATEGTMPPAFSMVTGISRHHALPLGLLEAGKPSEILIRLARDGGRVALPRLALGDSGEVAFAENVQTLLNFSLYRDFAFINLFIALYFFLQFALLPSRRYNLWFALANFFFGLYFLRMGAGIEALPYLPVLAFTKAAASPAFASLLLFFVEYFNILNKLWVKISAGAVALVFFFLQILLPGTSGALDGLFTLSLLPGQVMILTIVGIAVTAFRRGNREAIIILVGSVWGVGLGSHDIVMLATGGSPLAWLQGIGIFGFNLSMFVTLAVKSMKTSRELEEKSLDLEMQQMKLKSAAQDQDRLNRELSDLLNRLRIDLASAGKAAGEITRRSGEISRTLEDENSFVAETAEKVQDLSLSQSRIAQELEGQTRNISSTAASLEQMFRGIKEVTENLAETSRFVEKLTLRIEKGQVAVVSSGKAMERIQALSGQVTEILGAINEITERTDVLAINAAIQAAHSGTAGRGFAVVAQEIKKLASGSSARGKEIQASIHEIQKAISEGAQLSREVQDTLTAIQSEAEDAAAQVRQIDQALGQQKDAGEEIRLSAQSLQQSAKNIQALGVDQQESGRKILQRMEDLRSGFQRTSADLEALKQANQENEGTLEALRKLASG